MKTRSEMSGLFRLLSIGLVLGLALMPTPLVAQAVTGTILGTVRDTSGGALPGATVTILNQDTGFTRTVALGLERGVHLPTRPHRQLHGHR